MEHFWHTIDGYMNHRNTCMLDLAIQRFPESGIWVELGSWTGRSAAYCVVELLNHHKSAEFYCVDNWEGGIEHKDHDLIVTQSLREVFMKNVSPVADRIRQIDGISWEAAQNFADNTVDFCYVDAGHTYDCVTNDLQAWWPKIRPGSAFAGDDYTKGYPEVCRAVHDFFDRMGQRVDRVGRCWWTVKECQ